jgi:hypothetical protein
MLPQQEFDELGFADGPLGPSSEGVCKVSNGNSCGSGSLVGSMGGKSLVLTNAHVAGTKIGHVVRCYFPELDKSFDARVIMAGYSDRVLIDWAILEVLTGIVPLRHTKLSKKGPQSQEHYTAGYPRCRGPYYQKVTTRSVDNNGTLWRWQPNSIGGQSGSAIHSFEDGLQYGLLTWSWNRDGAGQSTRGIYWQATQKACVGFPKPPELIPLNDNMAADLEEGFFYQTDIDDLPIWAEDTPVPPEDPEDPDPEDPEEPDFGDFDPEVVADAFAIIAEQFMVISDEFASLFADDGDEDPEQPDEPEDDDEDGPLFGL